MVVWPSEDADRLRLPVLAARSEPTNEGQRSHRPSAAGLSAFNQVYPSVGKARGVRILSSSPEFDTNRAKSNMPAGSEVLNLGPIERPLAVTMAGIKQKGPVNKDRALAS